MTDTRDALMRTILANPADDTPRLVYADWLEENGESERAEFIRAQVRIGEIQRDCGCGACVKLRGGGQHHNGPCGINRERIENADGTSRQAFLRRRELELISPADWSVPAPGWCWEIRGLPGEPDRVVRWSRGFVSAVRCRLADWVGNDECERCHGDGKIWAAWSVKHESAIYPGRKRVDCPACHATGRTPALGPRIVAEHPVERVEVSDKRPITIGPRFYWTDQQDTPWGIGYLLSELAGESENNLNVDKGFASHELALSALSLALLNWARREAGLPPLEGHR